MIDPRSPQGFKYRLHTFCDELAGNAWVNDDYQGEDLEAMLKEADNCAYWSQRLANAARAVARSIRRELKK